jgi:ammonium transporter, Amt family
MVRKLGRVLLVALGGIALWTTTHAAAFAQDPGGADTLAADPAAPLTFVWLVVCTALVFLMQAGFLLVEAGFARAKNTVNIVTKNMVDFIIAALAFWAFGYAFMYGDGGFANPLIGLTGFGLLGNGYDVTNVLAFVFQLVFAATAATIVSGAMSERTKITSYMAYSFLVTALLYPIFGKWVWGGGWLAALGVHDFAGSGVVHALGGGVALAGAWLVGPRLGKYGPDGKARPMPAHNMVFVALGTLILMFGWIGFNGGSTLNGGDLRLSVIVANTLLASAAGGFIAMYITMLRTRGIVDLGKVCNGALAGLVGITAPCAVVAPWAAVVIGTVAGVVLLWSERFVENTLRVDDPVGAVSVHGTCGLWGLLAVGIFADGTYAGVSGLLVGNLSQFLVQLLMAGVITVWSVGGGYLIFSLIKSTLGLRVSEEEETAGLDIAEHGVPAYSGGFSSEPQPAMGD